ncbi:MAG: hypothetical protein Q9M27_03000 [Mariprofundaceae bacterium]|nr:hypothetical protein [Mariprofundaceae bacterium]
MRIKCQSVDDFIRNLKGATVYLDTVHVNRISRSIGETFNGEVHIYEISYQASAIIQLDAEAQALLECGEACGQDVRTSDGYALGSEKQAALHAKLECFCAENNLTIKPGLIDI